MRTESITEVADWSIPPTQVGPLTEDRRPVLLWVHTGIASVDAGEAQHRLVAGQAVWIPPGVPHGMRAEAGSVVLSVGLPGGLAGNMPESLSQVCVVAIPPGWENWLIQQSIDGMHIGLHVEETLIGRQSLIELIGRSHSERRKPPEPGERRSPPGLGGDALPMPRSREALNITRMVLRDPGLPWTVDDLAALERISIRTLQRHMLRETGMSFSEWRSRARISAALHHLAGGRSIGWTGRQVGYSTPAGFTKAFVKSTGSSPRDYVRRLNEKAPGPTNSAVVDNPAGAQPVIPARRAWTRVNHGHFLLWVHRGHVRVRIGVRRLTVEQGEAVWVPDSVPNTIEYAADSIAIPVGGSYAPCQPDIDALEVFSFPPEATTFLLHSSIVEYTLIRPIVPRPSFTEGLFREQFVTRASRSPARPLTAAVDRITDQLRRVPADSRTLGDWARELGVRPDVLSREFRNQTGESLPRWRARLRMDIARRLLHLGDSPGSVSKHLGYSSAAAFANAFAAVHGLSPRAYQRRELSPR